MNTLTHEKLVYARFDATQARFRTDVASDDFRLDAIRRSFAPLAGGKLLDLGCGKGRFADRLRGEGANVVGLDPSLGMLSHASGLPRVRGSALRLPFPESSFDGVFAVEVFQHLPALGVDRAIEEAARVLRPGGILAIVDKNAAALNARRPYLPAALVKWIDRKRGRWMYPENGPIRERWFVPGRLARRLGAVSSEVAIAHLLSPEEARRRVFRAVPRARLMTLWTAKKPGGTSLG